MRKKREKRQVESLLVLTWDAGEGKTRKSEEKRVDRHPGEESFRENKNKI